MNAKMKKRMIAVSGVIVIVLILVLAFVGGNTAATTLSVAEAAENPQAGQKVQVSGNVVQDSFATTDNVLTFKIYDPEGDPATHLEVRYDGAASSTFGNDVTAICTGKINEAGVLECSNLVTKCPSKYENADNALQVSQLLGYGNEVIGKVVKVTGTVAEGTLAAAGQGDRFVLAESDDKSVVLPVTFDGALSDEVTDGTTVVLTGAMTDDGKFAATDVALEG
ncbi:cytochrome c maturation protein CcmE domain-containing protein [Adlercreutzia caecimuris]|jgi:cytochrome c-type biogenesis protein CcmE|uniref:cytochrome c maturation protein CcmE domain-containing protein n=1 Tax=Adlercreutzia caecimuris TaxID=671266 RepID=UPI002570AD0C|nr:cytochrome c maturation protein CcmE [Adlercreutzia caecimuris]